MKILFITSTRIGDAVLSTGLLNYLKGKYPQAQVTIACGPLAAPLFQCVPNLENLIVLKRRKYSLHWIDLWARTVGQKWDIVVDLRGSAISYLLWTKKRYVWRSLNSLDHRVEQLAQMMNLPKPPSPTVWLGDHDYHKADELLSGEFERREVYIGIGPVANWTGKEWPHEQFKELIEALVSPQGEFPGATVLLFGSFSEKERIQPLVASLKDVKTLDLSGKLNLREAAACLKKCALYVGNDSGLMHLSAACGTPTVGLFGPSRVEHYAPWGDHCVAVQDDKPYEVLIEYNHLQESLLRALPVSRVLEAIHQLVAKKVSA